MKRNADNAGQAAIEFALMVVFLMVFILSILQLIGVIHTYVVLADSAKAGVRYAIVHGTGRGAGCSGPGGAGVTCTDATGANVKTAALNYARLSFHAIAASDIAVDYNPNGANGTACSSNNPSCLVRVTVAYLYQPLFGFSWPSVTVRAASEGRIIN
jgi:Flp pilus assembly protein TadG